MVVITLVSPTSVAYRLQKSFPETDPWGTCFSLHQLLQVKYGGWQNVSMANYFRDYADLCFEAFGDRVKHWITFSDPRVSRALLQGEAPLPRPRSSCSFSQALWAPLATPVDDGRKRL